MPRCIKCRTEAPASQMIVGAGAVQCAQRADCEARAALDWRQEDDGSWTALARGHNFWLVRSELVDVWRIYVDGRLMAGRASLPAAMFVTAMLAGELPALASSDLGAGSRLMPSRVVPSEGPRPVLASRRPQP